MKAQDMGIVIGSRVQYPSPLGNIWATVVEFAGAKTAVIVEIWERQHIIDVRCILQVRN